MNRLYSQLLNSVNHEALAPNIPGTELPALALRLTPSRAESLFSIGQPVIASPSLIHHSPFCLASDAISPARNPGAHSLTTCTLW
jgi:hypothetical protein